MKKDIFNGKIKKEYVSYLMTSYIVVSVLFLPLAGLFCFLFVHSPIEGKIICGILFLICLYLVVINPILTLFVIRQYPKRPKLRKLLLNSEYYFVGNNDRKASGPYRRNRAVFNIITYIIDKKTLKKSEWHYQLYSSLIDVSARRNNKKHKFWYERAQIKEIEALVSATNQNAKLKLEQRDDKLASFIVIDTSNNYTVFEGFFI